MTNAASNLLKLIEKIIHITLDFIVYCHSAALVAPPTDKNKKIRAAKIPDKP